MELSMLKYHTVDGRTTNAEPPKAKNHFEI